MENKVLKLGMGGRSTKDVYAEIRQGNAFSPNYNLPSNSYFTTKTTGLGSYTLTKVSTPSASSDTPILSSRFNPTKKYPLDLNFYWVAPT